MKLVNMKELTFGCCVCVSMRIGYNKTNYHYYYKYYPKQRKRKLKKVKERTTPTVNYATCFEFQVVCC